MSSISLSTIRSNAAGVIAAKLAPNVETAVRNFLFDHAIKGNEVTDGGEVLLTNATNVDELIALLLSDTDRIIGEVTADPKVGPIIARHAAMMEDLKQIESEFAAAVAALYGEDSKHTAALRIGASGVSYYTPRARSSGGKAGNVGERVDDWVPGVYAKKSKGDGTEYRLLIVPVPNESNKARYLAHNGAEFVDVPLNSANMFVTWLSGTVLNGTSSVSAPRYLVRLTDETLADYGFADDGTELADDDAPMEA